MIKLCLFGDWSHENSEETVKDYFVSENVLHILNVSWIIEVGKEHRSNIGEDHSGETSEDAEHLLAGEEVLTLVAFVTSQNEENQEYRNSNQIFVYSPNWDKGNVELLLVGELLFSKCLGVVSKVNKLHLFKYNNNNWKQ